MKAISRLKTLFRFLLPPKDFPLYGSYYKFTYREMSWKCFWAYLKQSVFQGKDTFEIRYGAVYYHPFKKRFKDWLTYFANQRFWFRYSLLKLKLVKPKTICDLMLIGGNGPHHAFHPFHPKIHVGIDESILYDVIEDNGFIVVEEDLQVHSTIYRAEIKK